jgi:mono/diheme cytochrome c family protein
LQTATLDQIDGPANNSFATTPRPFGLWQQQPGCNFAASVNPVVHPVSWYTGANRPHWMDVINAPPDAPVYEETPGAAVFKMICINCHGPLADANGRLAQNLATMTGGNALVADFRDGLFGPRGASLETTNRYAVFGDAQIPAGASANWTAPLVNADDRAARYMAWMGLGGTSVNIPIAVLQVVAITKVLDQIRSLDATSLSANMLSQAKALCFGLLGPPLASLTTAFDSRPGHGYLDAKIDGVNPTLIPENGDAELWLQLCAVANPAPVHILTLGGPSPYFQLGLATDAGTLVDPATYPAGFPIGDQQSIVRDSLLPGNVDSQGNVNLWPWCVDDTLATPAALGWLQQNPQIPICPPAVKDADHACVTQPDGATCFGEESANQWAVRGAINAGFSVFTYVRSIENSSPPLDFNQCNLLQ